MLSPGAKVVFCANLNATNVQIKHSVTALKFATKIREAIQKRMSKVGRRQTIDLETAFGRDVQDIENELTILKQKLFRLNNQHMSDGGANGEVMPGEDHVLGQFAQILDKYDYKLYLLRQSAQRNFASGDHQSAYNSIRADAQEAEKIKFDLSRLRQEIEQADIEEEETRRTNHERVMSQQMMNHSQDTSKIGYFEEDNITDNQQQQMNESKQTVNLVENADQHVFQGRVGAPTPNFLSMRGLDQINSQQMENRENRYDNDEQQYTEHTETLNDEQ